MDDAFKFVQHLGPRYTAHFQAKDLVHFLTYETVTSLNVYLSNAGGGTRHIAAPSSGLIRIIKSGMGISEEAFLFSIFPSSYASVIDEENGVISSNNVCVHNGVSSTAAATRGEIEVVGDVFPVNQSSLDVALWKVGGAPVVLRLVELASVSHINTQ